MIRIRIIPTLLLKNAGLVKGVNFENFQYIGDPINAVKIFNEKGADELVFLDISASPSRLGPNFELIQDIASEAFMPFAYGGGITAINQIEKLFRIGVEKIIINSAAHSNPELIRNASSIAGSQSIVVSIDVRKSIFGSYEVYTKNGSFRTRENPIDYARRMEDLGAGELIVCSINQEGTGKGYDIKLINDVSRSVSIPVVASGGAAEVRDFAQAVNVGMASAVAAGSMFVFHGKRRGVLITYPRYDDLEAQLKQDESDAT